MPIIKNSLDVEDSYDPSVPGCLGLAEREGFTSDCKLLRRCKIGNGVSEIPPEIPSLPAFDNRKQEQRRQRPFCCHKYQMLTMDFNRGRSHMLECIASEPHQKRLVRHETVCA